MPALICGSLAFDTITNFNGHFKDQILPDQIHILNVSFLIPTLRREFGGVAGNIAYNLKQLGGEPLIMATVGADGHDYMGRLADWGVTTDFVRVEPEMYTAQAIIMTDMNNNQITAFHPGAMANAHLNVIRSAERFQLAILGPDSHQATLEHAQQLADLKVPFIFDPGQALPMFNGEELLKLVDQATWTTVNDYEGRMLCDRTGLSLAEISKRLPGGLVVTLADQGCDVWRQGECTHVDGVKAEAVLDPTGCGDAFRAGLLHGLELGWPLDKAAALGNRIGAIKIAHHGPQNHRLDKASLGL